MNNDKEKMIVTENLSFSYPVNEGEEGQVYVFSDLNIEIEKGSFVTILGHNGSGKSTLAKHFNAILLPSGGTCYVNGIDTKDEKHLYDIRKNTGMVFQNPDNQIVAAIVEDEVAFAPENLGIEPQEIRNRVDNALEVVGMSDYKTSATTSLSGGQKQRIAISSILAMNPKCIVLDEPTAMLDPIGRKDVISTIKKLNKEQKITVILITHYMDEAVYSDRIIVMDNGKILLDDIPKAVFSQYDMLNKIGLDVPQVSELIYKLNQCGFDLPNDIISIDECADCLIKYLK